MKYIKFILIIIGLYLLVTLGFAAIGVVSTVLWYLFLLGIVAGGGAVGYKFLKKDTQQPKLEDKTPVAIAEIQNADRVLEEYKRKTLSK